MNILILGEYSGFTKNLVKGLKGISSANIVIFANKDGFKSITQDAKTYSYKSAKNISILGKEIKKTYLFSAFAEFIKFKKDIKQYESYFDVVFILNPEFVRPNYCVIPLFSTKDIDYVKKKDAKVYLSACGLDSVFLSFLKQTNDFSYSYLENIYQGRFFATQNRIALEYVDYIIPVTAYYAEAYANSFVANKVLRTIPLPFDIDSVEYTENTVKDKVTIFNGVLQNYKGAEYVERALAVIQNKYKDRIEIINERMPYAEFLKCLGNINIYIDQCSLHHGMAALISMSAGCVTFTGSSENEEKVFNYSPLPVVSIFDNIDEIVEKLDWWINHPDEFSEQGYKSRKYVETVHECNSVAKLFLETIKQSL